MGEACAEPEHLLPVHHGSPDDVAAKACGAGEVADDSVIGDTEESLQMLNSLPPSNRKVGAFGTCSSGRQKAFLVACRLKGLDTAVNRWGGRVVMSKEELTSKRPVSSIEYTKDLS